MTFGNECACFFCEPSNILVLRAITRIPHRRSGGTLWGYQYETPSWVALHSLSNSPNPLVLGISTRPLYLNHDRPFGTTRNHVGTILPDEIRQFGWPWVDDYLISLILILT